MTWEAILGTWPYILAIGNALGLLFFLAFLIREREMVAKTWEGVKYGIGSIYKGYLEERNNRRFAKQQAEERHLRALIPPAIPLTYLLFFDWGEVAVKPRALAIAKEAAENLPKVDYTRIEVHGHADNTGTPRDNQRLSIKRAQAVADALVENGAERDLISVHGFGDTKLLVATGRNVREPQNRRVEIYIVVQNDDA